VLRLRGGAIADTFAAGGLRIERRHDRWNGVSYMAWKPHVSMLFTDTKELLAFIAWPRKTPTGDALRKWLNLEPTEPAPVAELEASGFGPDPGDPNHQTRTII
jgi:hypothetical protein